MRGGVYDGAKGFAVTNKSICGRKIGIIGLPRGCGVKTLNYIENLKKCGISAKADVYHCNIHAFDMLKPKLEVSKQAVAKFLEEFAYAQDHHFSEQNEKRNDN